MGPRDEVAIKVNSVVFDPPFEISFEKGEMRAVYRAVQKLVKIPEDHTNSKINTDVYIGNVLRESAFSLDVVSNVAAFMWASEPELNQVFDVNRAVKQGSFQTIRDSAPLRGKDGSMPLAIIQSWNANSEIMS